MSWFSAAAARLSLIFAPRSADARMRDEMDFHIDMESARLAREEQLPPTEARRRALVAFGGVTQRMRKRTTPIHVRCVTTSSGGRR